MLLFTLGCSPLVGDYDAREDWSHAIVQADQLSEAPADPESLVVMTYNMKFGGGRVDFWFDGYGDRAVMTTEEATANVEGLRALVEEFDPDILLAQEVDVHSHRSAYVDMADVVLNGTDLNWSAFVPNWEGQYIADHGIGPMYTGLVVFSKYAITENTRIDLGPIEEQEAYIKTFYLDRALQRVEVDLGSETLTALNHHPAAYATDGTKLRQIEQSFDEAQTVEGHFLSGGDYNAVPPGSLRLSEFADDPVSLDERAVEIVTYEDDGPIMDPWYEAWNPAIPLIDYQVDTEEEQAAFHTHSIASDVFWTRKLDFLFSTGTWADGRTIQKPEDTPGGTLDPMALSDHCPLVGTLTLGAR
jgi:endonuclease/exonuclease/phosphatase family metal-dependent hydrolase